jgi:hypothetical protein
MTARPVLTFIDPDIHDALASMPVRRLNGSIPVHDKYGAPFDFFAPTASKWIPQVLGKAVDFCSWVCKL